MAKKQLSPFEQAYADARRRWASGQGGATFSFGNKSYSVASREEAARQKAMMQSPTRGRGTNRAEAPAPKPSAGIPGAGPYTAPPSAGGAMSDTRRNLQNIVAAIPAARAVGMAGKAAQATAAARAAPAAKRIEPLMSTSRTQGIGQFRAASGLAEKGKQAMPDKTDRIPAFKQGGLVTKKR
jgi:hypothetical protein